MKFVTTSRFYFVIFFVIWLVVAFGARWYKLTSVPSVISHDEIYYPVQAKTIALSFSDPSQTWNPLSFTAANPLYAELPGFVMAPASVLFDNPLISARFTHTVLGVLTCILLAGIAQLLIKQKIAFYTTLAVATFNPWLFQFSRMGFDALFSIFFYCLAIYMLLLNKYHSRYLALAPLFLGFYQYQGLKIIFLPLLFIVLSYILYSEQKKTMWSTLKSNRVLLFIFGSSVLLFCLHLLRLGSQEAGGRVNDLIFFDPDIPRKVELLRQQTITNPLLEIATNKWTVILQRFLEQYANSFNIVQLFLTGEPLRNPFSVWTHGMFYFLDIVPIAVGFVWLFSDKKLRAVGFLLLGLLLISPLPSAITASGVWIMFRSSFMVPVFLLTGGIGLTKLISLLPTKVFIAFFVFYFILVGNFMYDYFYRYPLYGTGNTYFSERLVANYLTRTHSAPTIVLADETEFMYLTILHFGKWVEASTLAQIAQSYQKHEYQIGSVAVDNRCIDPQWLTAGITVIAQASIPFCDSQRPAAFQPPVTAIPSLLDSGEQFVLYNDALCSDYDLGRFSRVNTDVFAVEQLETSEFCKQFFIWKAN